ncbi:MAG: hypothetical protein KH112_12450 [Sanguibacteroides justesenii]|uniref:hypothetical protein n=1 Tax=Butyricimonas faecalis TaxID=2093856 RepID=UPI001D8AB075|nr:hypothetical protein [Sanguibacteroides justesenii]
MFILKFAKSRGQFGGKKAIPHLVPTWCRGIIVSCQTAMKRGRCVNHSFVVPYFSLNSRLTLFGLSGIS